MPSSPLVDRAPDTDINRCTSIYHAATIPATDRTYRRLICLNELEKEHSTMLARDAHMVLRIGVLLVAEEMLIAGSYCLRFMWFGIKTGVVKFPWRLVENARARVYDDMLSWRWVRDGTVKRRCGVGGMFAVSVNLRKSFSHRRQRRSGSHT